MSTKKVPLADVLWDAANQRLLNRSSLDDEPPLEFSCNAALAAERGSKFQRVDIRTHHAGLLRSAAVDFLESLGCNPNHVATEYWRRANDIQGARYMWLLLAMHVAEDEGILIEVES